MQGPRATYRLQLHRGFGFDDAAGVVEYLHGLGISHLYLSPVLESSPGSPHGYDATDPTRLDEERGGRLAFGRLAERARALGLGLVLDIVPNHLAVSPRNRWWWDVLENGPSSRWAHVFDVDWASGPGEEGDARVLLPILGDHYGRALERCEIQIRREEGSFAVAYFDHRFPLSPRTVDDLLRRAAHASGSARLAFLADAFGDLEAGSEVGRAAGLRRHRDKEELRRLLVELFERRPGVRSAVDAELEALNVDFARLDQLLQRQCYRLSYWRLAGTQLNYRRFFDVNSLVGVRVEVPDVFEEGHEVVLGLVRDGFVEGLRVDHPDGLRDPRAYFHRLARAAPGCWIVAEKILEPNEHLPVDWGIAGTTGYDFLTCVQGLFVDPRAEFPLSETYRAFLHDEGEERWLDLVYARKLAVCRDLLAGDVTRLVHHLREICDTRRRFRDFTRPELRQLVEVLVACWPVYRTYVRVPEGGEPGHVAPEDVDILHTALDLARRREPTVDEELLGLFEQLLTLREPVARLDPGQVPVEHELVMRFQQLTGPVMAKGVEDTCFYRYNRLVALNEVGGDPSRFGTTPKDFHLDMELRWKERPTSMLGTSTHDTKRSEDVRARLCVISEVHAEWAEAVERWSAMNEGRRRSGGIVVDRNMEYLLYQTLVGAWPERVDGAIPLDWTERVVAYMDKASKEAKARTTWLAPDLELPEAEPRGWTNVLTGERVEDPMVRLETLFGLAPVALLVRDAGEPAREAAERRRAADGAARPATEADAPRGGAR